MNQDVGLIFALSQYLGDYLGSHLYHESPKGIPKGLKLVPYSAKICLFEFVCS